MRKRLCSAAIAAGVASAVPAPAAAQNVVEAASKWGLIGTWALDCAKPASDGNGYLTFVIRRAGQLTYERDFGERQDVNDVTEVKTGVGGSLEVVIRFAKLGQTRRITFAMRSDGRTRTMASSKADGSEPTVKDGKFLFNGAETPWQTRCR